MDIFLILIFSAIAYNPCSDSVSKEEIKEVIQIIKTRLNVKSLKCIFTSEKRTLIDKKEGHDEYYKIGKKDFALQGKNLFISQWIEESHPAPRNTPSKPIQNKTISSEKSNNAPLLNVIIRTLNQDKTIQNPNKPLMGGLVNFYLYKGEPSCRLITKDELNKTEIVRWSRWTKGEKIEEVNLSASSGDPRWLIGYIGKNLTNSYESYPRRTIPEALEKPGKFYYREKDGYRILWHETQFDDLTIEDSEEVSFEVWIDSNDNIVKIQEGIFFVRTYGYEKVRSHCKDCERIDCDFPVFIYRTFEFDQFFDVGNGVRIPLYGKITRYKEHDDEKEKYISLIEQLERNEIGQFEYGIQYSLLRMQETDVVQVYIHPDTLIVNEPIDEKVFIAPAPTDELEEKATSWYKKYLNTLLFFSFIMLCLLITTLIDKKFIRNRIILG